ncbi:acyl-CoA dehydrogenase family protein [Mycolicibacterium llatzerense]|uniref:acyl-CoA dehydrogenase family protein n=1 Tax=Mycolicibacterium llatzerense TaxID=280871 RepID=UPI0005BC4A85|nr:acyl-CoA dehydrogenase family protein [Mycolicibacterium llatzerense]MCT7368946.1 acyl-CoA dehydrogenase [Mycolicibacterium llatzerense]
MELSAEERQVVATVRDWVDREVRPVARDLEHANEYPEKLIDQMKQMGIFGLAIPEPYGDAPVSTQCYVGVTEQLARGWMSLAGAMGGHTVVSKLILNFGTDDQKSRYLPRMATGEIRATMALTEPGGGSDLQAMTTVARRDEHGYVINGAKTWISNARRSQLIALLCKTDPAATPRHRGISILLVEHGPGLIVSRDLPKLGYKGVESCELAFDDFRASLDTVLGGVEGHGFAQMMKGLETGRIQVASRALGVGQAAFDDALAYAQQRESFGVPIWKHQAVGGYLADMATKLTAARQLVLHAAQRFDAGERCDMEAGMAKYYASEVAMEVALNAVRIHGGYGYSTEYDVERYFRDAPLMIVGEGTNEIQRNVIAAQLVARGGLTA